MADPLVEERSASARILLVEDDTVQRMWVTDVLETEGFEVLAAANAEAALETLRRADKANRPVRAVITDVQMPGAINGLDLVHRIRQSWPHIEIVIVSGYCDAMNGIPAEVRVLRKPVNENLLAAIVHHIERAGSWRR